MEIYELKTTPPLQQFTELAYLYRPGQSPERIDAYRPSLSGEDVLPGFTFDLRTLL